MNTTYVEHRQVELGVYGRETYWSLEGGHFLFWCAPESRWKGSISRYFKKVQAGNSAGFIGAPQGIDILEPFLLRGWHEWCDSHWIVQQEAGVWSIGPLNAPLRVVTLSGFQRSATNADYMERRQPEYTVNNRETYWSCGGEQFLYWCKRDKVWKGCRCKDFPRVQGGNSLGLTGAPPGSDVASDRPQRGWHEWYRSAWVLRAEAGTAGCIHAELRTVSLCGFQRGGMNTTYVERRDPHLVVEDREVYVSQDGQYFLYWCSAETRWKGCLSSHFQKVQKGGSLGLLGAPLGVDLLAPSLCRGWHEWIGSRWLFHSKAGVSSFGTAADVKLPSPLEQCLVGGSGNTDCDTDPDSSDQEDENVEVSDSSSAYGTDPDSSEESNHIRPPVANLDAG